MGNTPDDRPTASTRTWELTALAAALLILASPLLYLLRSEFRISPQPAAGLEFVGSEACAPCHRKAYDDWRQSHHFKAMAVADEESVLGDFDDAAYTDPYNLVTSRFFRKDGGFFVETEGAAGTLEQFEITHTFGVYPLQQYLIPFPGGRLQCLNIAWDARDERWYRLPPYEVDGPSDWLHWTNGGQTWNAMCAECHSTNLKKNFDPATDSYRTSWFEISVGCEACHGPGSEHVAWAGRPALARQPRDDFGLAVSTGATTNREQIAICAPCHSRRFQLGDNDHRSQSVLDTMVPSLLDEGLYFADGQIREEVYVYGSYIQSKMYAHGIACTDCHDIHGLTMHAEGNELCLRCHRAAEYDRYEHHFHKREHEGRPSNGHSCVACHMPGRYYMGIDYRPDHSLRVPRPDLSGPLGTPSSCATRQCHADKPQDWITDHYRTWYGTTSKPHYGEILKAGQELRPGAGDRLRTLVEDRLVPVIVRATALSLLRRYPDQETLAVLSTALEDPESLLRYTAIRSLAEADDLTRLELIAPKLYDPVRAVRIEAAAALAKVPGERIRADDRAAFAAALDDYRGSMRYNSDFAPQRYNLGNLAAALGNRDEAVAYYRQAIDIDEQFYPAKVNLAMLYNRDGENGRAEALLREVVRDHPDLYEVFYSLGLLLAEMERFEEAAEILGTAADGMPDYSRPRYNQALALLKLERWEEGERALRQALEVDPANREYFSTLANLYLNFRLNDQAEALARQILEAVPDHPEAAELLRLLRP